MSVSDVTLIMYLVYDTYTGGLLAASEMDNGQSIK